MRAVRAQRGCGRRVRGRAAATGARTRCDPPVRVRAARAAHVRDDDVYLCDDDGLPAELGRLGGTGTALLADPALREIVLPILRNDYRLAERYRPTQGIRLRCPVTAMIGNVDPEVTGTEARRREEVTGAPFDLRVLPGDHFYLTPQRDAVVAEVVRRLVPAPAARTLGPSTP
ncbi:thioesterase II family protein [Embleya sp. NPDC050154]|uniref:thioesterase II family protein n=1 Tax=Embleya sp. NPDC050154 TaxID=3363988 RepID=UPI00379AC44E